MVEEADEGARNLAEAPSLGTNPDMELTGVQTTDKKKLGTINFAIGDNVSLGGTVESDLHLDGIVLNGTLEFDGETFGGETLIEDGEFDVERAFELAEQVADRV
jgi:leucyl aminopeptidase (aminopeptidase T)